MTGEVGVWLRWWGGEVVEKRLAIVLVGVSAIALGGCEKPAAPVPSSHQAEPPRASEPAPAIGMPRGENVHEHRDPPAQPAPAQAPHAAEPPPKAGEPAPAKGSDEPDKGSGKH